MRPSSKSRFLGFVLFATSVSLFAQAPVSNRKFQVIEIRGTPHERGLQHGKLLRASIRRAVDAWKEDLRGTYGADPDVFIKKFLATTDYVPAIEKWTPDLLQEVRGIAEGAGVDFSTMLVYQLPDEYWVNGSVASRDHCSALGVAATKDHSSIVAQNADLEGFRDGFQTILHITEPTGLEQFVLTAPGLIGFNGMNSKGVGVTTNTLTQLASRREGLPVAFVVRGVLERVGFNEARAFLRAIRHASGQNYTLGGGGRVACFEASANKVIQIDPPNAGAFVYHTNHPVANEDYSGFGILAMANADPTDSSHTRYDALRKRLSADPGKGIIDMVQATLRSRDSELYPVCRPHRDNQHVFTYASTIMVLDTKPYLIAAPGPPDQYEYSVFRFAAKGNSSTRSPVTAARRFRDGSSIVPYGIAPGVGYNLRPATRADCRSGFL